jgi:uncharacterized protein YjiS (DUF1127 family)
MSNSDFAPGRPVVGPSASARGWFTGLVIRLVRWVLSAQRQHTDSTRLHNMDDYMLKDIGLQRDQIDDLLRSSASLRWRSTRTAGY